MTQDNNANKPTDNAGQITAEEKYQAGKKAVDYQRQLTLFGEQAANTVLYFWIQGYDAASLVAEERCREKDKEWSGIYNEMVNLCSSKDERITTLEKTIAWKDQQLEIRDRQLEEVKIKADKLVMVLQPFNDLAIEVLKNTRSSKTIFAFNSVPLTTDHLVVVREALTAHQEQKQGGKNEK